MAESSDTKAPALVKIYGDPRSSASYSIRDFLHRSDVDFEFVPLTTDEEARTKAGVLHPRDSRLPVCVFPDGTRMECPTIRQITEKLGWFVNPSRSEYDLAIYGAGPAGLSAAVYGDYEGIKTVVVERGAGARAGVQVRRRDSSCTQGSTRRVHCGKRCGLSRRRDQDHRAGVDLRDRCRVPATGPAERGALCRCGRVLRRRRQ
jgi:hypothetical protein